MLIILFTIINTIIIIVIPVYGEYKLVTTANYLFCDVVTVFRCVLLNIVCVVYIHKLRLIYIIIIPIIRIFVLDRFTNYCICLLDNLRLGGQDICGLLHHYICI